MIFREQGSGLRFDTDEYKLLRRLVMRQAGLHLSRDKRREVASKLSTSWPPSSTGAQVVAEAARSPERLQAVVESLTVGETYFFRNRPHMRALVDRILPELLRAAAGRPLACWSAGCATGEEAYTLALLLRDHFPGPAAGEAAILGTDVNRQYLGVARKGRYPTWSLRGVEEDLRRRHFEPSDDNGHQLRRSVREAVRFEEHNLSTDAPIPHRPTAGFDLVLCRNVLLYFPTDVADAVVGRLIRALRPGGYLFVGHADAHPALQVLETVFEAGTFFYRKPQGPAPARATLDGAVAIPGLPVRLATPHPGTVAPKVPPAPRPEEIRGVEGARRSVVSAARLEEIRRVANAGRTEDALAQLDGLLARDGTLDARVHMLRALVLSQADEDDSAEESLRRALYLQRDLVVAHYLLAVHAERRRDWGEAERCYRNTAALLADRPSQEVVAETGGITAARLLEMARMRLGVLGELRDASEGDPRPGGRRA